MSSTRQKPNQRCSKHQNGCKAAFLRVKSTASPINTGASSYENNSNGDGRMTSNALASYTYDAASRNTGITQNLWASLITTATATSTVTVGTSTNTVTNTVTISAITSYYATPISWTVTYDRRNRVTGFNRPSAQTSYTYDANSNRLSAINKKVADIDLDGDFDQLDKAQNTAQTLSLDSTSNKLLGFSQTLTTVKGTKTLSTTNSSVNYALDANGNMTTDGLRSFSYDEANRHSQTSVTKDGEAAKVTYLHNALGQRVFKSEPQVAQTIPNETTLGTTYIDWLKKNLSWLFAAAQTNATLGQSYVYADGQLPDYAMLGEYGNGGASSSGRLEYIWLPTEDGQATPIGLFRSGKFLAVHSDHLNTPRLITDDANKAVWQWPYTAFGDNKPTGILKATANPSNAYTQDPTTNARLQATSPGVTYNARFAGQYFDSETGLHQNFFRSFNAGQGRFTQNDPIGLEGGLNRFAYVEGNPVSFVDPTGEIAFIPIVIGIGAGYAFDYLLEKYKKEHCTCKDTPAGAAGNAALGGALGGSGPFASKPRAGVAGGGPAGSATSSFSQMNHAAASRGAYSVATRNGITKVLRKVPYVGSAIAAYEVYDAFTCD